MADDQSNQQDQDKPLEDDPHAPQAQPEDDTPRPQQAPEQSNVAADPDVDTSDDPEHNPPQNG